MTHGEFQPDKLNVGDWLCIAYHSNFRVKITYIDGRKVGVTNMPYPLMYGEYWPVELTLDIITKNQVEDVYNKYKDKRELKYVHQLQKLLRELNIENEIEL